MEDKYEFHEKLGRSKHVHTLNGQPMFGTTTVLGIIAKPQLVQWAANLSAAAAFKIGTIPGLSELLDTFEKIDYEATQVIDKLFPMFKKARLAHREKAEKAADWGKIVHKAIQDWIASGIIPQQVEFGDSKYEVTADHLAAINHFISWANNKNAKFLFSEKGIYSKEWWVGGIVDIICEIDGKIYVVDIKTSSDIYEENFLQTAAYAKMAVERGLIEHVHGMIILNLKKDGTFKEDTRYHVDENIKCFEAALTLYKRFLKD